MLEELKNTCIRNRGKTPGIVWLRYIDALSKGIADLIDMSHDFGLSRRITSIRFDYI